MSEETWVAALIVALPNWAGFIILTITQNRFNSRLMDMLEKRAQRDSDEHQNQ